MWTLFPRWLGFGVDAVVSRMVHALSGNASAVLAACPSCTGSGGGSWQRAAAPVAGSPAATSWQPAVLPAHPEAPPALPQADLEEEALLQPGVKLVQYTIVSIRPCAERILPGGEGEVLITDSVTSEGFAVTAVAQYLQSPGYTAAVQRNPRLALPHEDKKYLRVYYQVLDCWPTQQLCCENERRRALLEGIRGEILRLGGRWSPAVAGRAAPRALAAPPVEVAAPAPPVAALPELDEELQQVLGALRERGGEASNSELVHGTGLSQSRVRRSLRALEALGRIRRSGQGLQTRYHAVN